MVVVATSAISRLSVSSRVRWWGFMPVVVRVWATWAARWGLASWTADTLTLMLSCWQPARSRSADRRGAAPQAPMATSRPLSSASGTKLPGANRPRVGCCQPLSGGDRVGRAGGVLHQDDELVAAEPGHGVAGPHGGG